MGIVCKDCKYSFCQGILSEMYCILRHKYTDDNGTCKRAEMEGETMQYKLAVKDGKVNYLMEAGSQLVSGAMRIDNVNGILQASMAERSEMKGYPIRIGSFMFQGEILPEKEPKKGKG